MKIYLNKNPAGHLNNMVFGLCCICDGLVNIFSLGLLSSNISLWHTSRTMRRYFEKLKESSKI